MAFDQKTRNLLQRTVAACRRVLDREFTAQLQELYGIQPDGALTPCAVLEHLGDEDLEIARLLRERINHLEGGSAVEAFTRTAARPEHIARVIREQAFTVLNRLAALRLCEERGLVLECVRQGVNSEGFRLFTSSAGHALGETHEAYRVYLHCLFDELALDLGVLFTRFSPLALLFPRPDALTEVLAELNGSGKAAEREEMPPEQFAEIWQADETIGWIYQYYNDEAERKKMREESSAPRNSRELAVRNQFFTPRYVVEFLTDNTLGRIWYEMTQGTTKLKEQCHYLVRRPNEIFLKPGEVAPASDPGSSRGNEAQTSPPAKDQSLLTSAATKSTSAASSSPSPPSEGGEGRDGVGAALSQEDLLRAPVHIPHRPLKDPRTILMLDPACGSMHFGLYAFDLFEVIYDEAWDMAARMKDACRSVTEAEIAARYPQFSSFILYTSSFQSKEEFLRQVPRLIIEHNLHGIDIDPRCAQIAGLSLWLRAQRAWKDMGIAPAQRPVIKRSNIVCAEPMPGEKELLRDFVEREFPAAERAVCLRLLEAIFDKMQLAGEAGSLLKIEEEIRSAIEDARDSWQKLQSKPAELFSTAELNQVSRQPELTDLDSSLQSAIGNRQSAITGDFWERLEERIYAALRDYAEQAENGGGFQRRLFAEDAARGFAFIDICKKRYDVALMNPPFGDASLPSKPYLDETYGDTKGDVYKAFVECFHARLVPAGYLGIISSRTGFFLGQSEDWRTRVVLRLFRPIALADLGSGVLDAMVEVAAYVLRSLSASEARDLTHSIVPLLEKVVRDSQDRFSLPKWQAARGVLKRHQAVAELEHLEAHGFVQRSPGDIVRYKPLWHEVKKVTPSSGPVFPPLVCVRALGELEKAEVLKEAIGNASHSGKFICDPACFSAISGHTFAYWVSGRVLARFRTLPTLETGPRIARQGGVNGDDFRHLRLAWECLRGAEQNSHWRWTPFAKGGEFSRFYLDLTLQILWDAHRTTFASFTGLPHRPTPKPASCEDYFRPGVTWSRRSQRGLSLRALPAGCVFADKGPSVFVQDDAPSVLGSLLALTNSSPFRGFVALQMAFGSYEVGVIQRTPVPHLEDSNVQLLARLAGKAWGEKRAIDSAQSTSHAFFLPALLRLSETTLAERAAAWAARVCTCEETVAAIQAEIDDLAFRLYGLDAADRAALTSTLATEATGDAASEVGEDEDTEAATADTAALTADLLGYGLGVAFGRWDIRYATGEQAAPELPDPFAPLPVCPPGQLQNAQGLPVTPAESGKLEAEGYPIEIPWDGILVDDPNHPLDLERRVREVIAIIWGEGGAGCPQPAAGGAMGTSRPTPESIEAEACEILGVKSLRDYFRKPAGFFADHLKRYSKSRRQAPIYWPLATASGSYTLWIYYHRLTPDTLYKCVQQFVNPKLADVEKELTHLRTILAANEGGPKERKRLEELEDLRRELIELRTELELWAPKWKPNLNDGVLITAAPLWKLFRLPKWQKDLKACWQELEKGDYDWSHLAYTLWPDRVREKCKSDRSLAIAHGLEELCEVKPPAKKTKRGKPSSEQMDLEKPEA